jgi:hypothetical protein
LSCLCDASVAHSRRFANHVEERFRALPSFTKYDFQRGPDPHPHHALRGPEVSGERRQPNFLFSQSRTAI